LRKDSIPERVRIFKKCAGGMSLAISWIARPFPFMGFRKAWILEKCSCGAKGCK